VVYNPVMWISSNDKIRIIPLEDKNYRGIKDRGREIKHLLLFQGKPSKNVQVIERKQRKIT